MDEDDVLLSFEVNADLAEEIDRFLHEREVKIGTGIATLIFVAVQRELSDATCWEEFQLRIQILHVLMRRVAINSYEHEKQEADKNVKH